MTRVLLDMGRIVRLWLVLLIFGVSFVISAIGVTESVETRLVPVFSTQPRCGVGDEPFYYLEIVDSVTRFVVRLLFASGLTFATFAGIMLHRRVMSLLRIPS